MLRLICVLQLMLFGVRSAYLVLFPDFKFFPNVTLPDDFEHLFYGLLWASLAIVAMIVGYRISRKQLPKAILATINRATLAWTSRATSATAYLIPYLLGWAGRAYMVKSGEAFWLYNSPSFDLIAERPDAWFMGLVSLISDLCPLVFACRNCGMDLPEPTERPAHCHRNWLP